MTATLTNREQELSTLIRARYPLLYLVAWEERRIEQLLRRVAGSLRKKLYGWSITDGLRPLDEYAPQRPDPETCPRSTRWMSSPPRRNRPSSCSKTFTPIGMTAARCRNNPSSPAECVIWSTISKRAAKRSSCSAPAHLPAGDGKGHHRAGLFPAGTRRTGAIAGARPALGARNRRSQTRPDPRDARAGAGRRPGIDVQPKPKTSSPNRW